MLSAPASGNGAGPEEDPAAAFLAQQESDIAGIENDEGFSILDGGEVPSSLAEPAGGWTAKQQQQQQRSTPLLLLLLLLPGSVTTAAVRNPGEITGLRGNDVTVVGLVCARARVEAVISRRLRPAAL